MPILKFYFMYIDVLPACVRESDPSVTEVIDSCEPSCGCWELNMGPQEEQPVHLTAEPSLQHQHIPFLITRNPTNSWLQTKYTSFR